MTTPTKHRRWLIVFLWSLILGVGLYIWQSQSTPDYEVRAFKTSAGWGYEISQGNQPLVYQPYQPGVAGKHGFATEGQAVRVGQRVVKKLQQGQFPPTLTTRELN